MSIVFCAGSRARPEPCVRGPPQAEEAGFREGSLACIEEMRKIPCRLQRKEDFAVSDTVETLQKRTLQKRLAGVLRNRFAADVAEADKFLPIFRLRFSRALR